MTEEHEKGRSPAERLAKPPVTLMEKAVLLSQGAEARVYRVQLGETTAIVKERFTKRYRHPVLDARLTAQRIRSEVRNMARAAAAGICVAHALYVDKAAGRIVMEDLGSTTAKARLWADRPANGGAYSAAAVALCSELGRVVGLLHAADLCHGDLTTSNFIVTDGEQLAVIDFGLSFISASLEDKAVDLYVLERAFLCTHLESAALVQAVLTGYKLSFAKAEQVIQRLDQVRARGRKKLAFG